MFSKFKDFILRFSIFAIALIISLMLLGIAGTVFIMFSLILFIETIYHFFKDGQK